MSPLCSTAQVAFPRVARRRWNASFCFPAATFWHLSRQTRVFGFKHLDNTFPLAGGSDEQTAGEGALSGPEGPTLPV